MADQTQAPRLWTTDDVAEFLGMGRRTVERMRTDGSGPRYLLVGRSVRYIPGSVRQWVAAQVITPEDETPAPARPRAAVRRG